MSGHLVFLAAFFMQPYPAAASEHIIVTYFHADGGADACEGVGHGRDQCAIAQTHQRGRFDRVEQFAGLVAGEVGRLTFSDDMLGPTNGVGRIHLNNVAGHQPVEQHAQGGQVLFHRGGCQLLLQIFDKGGHMKRPDLGELADAMILTPQREAPDRDEIGATGVVVIDLRGEKLEHALGRFGARRTAGREPALRSASE